MINSKKVQVDKEHYFGLKYDSKARWVSYWHQINEVVETNPSSVLEIGVGNKTVSDYLKKIGIKITTCDFDKSLKPDVVSDVTKLPFPKTSFDTVLCAEVLEHLPFNKFPISLIEIYRVAKKYSVMTLPHFSITDFYFGAKIIPFISRTEISLKIDVPITHKFSGEHYWEIGKKGYSLGKIEETIKHSGFAIEKSFYPTGNPYHHFFVLKK